MPQPPPDDPDPPAKPPAHPGPRLTAPTVAAKTDRDAKLAAALRENLKRRKAQARAREDRDD